MIDMDRLWVDCTSEEKMQKRK